MKEWIEIIIGISSIVALAGGGVLAWLIAVRYRIPQLERRVQALEDINFGEARTLVHKNEIYNGDGSPIYMHRNECDRERGDCVGDRRSDAAQMRSEFKAVLAQLDAMEEARARARIQMIAFMAAVKEKLSLKFTIPED